MVRVWTSTKKQTLTSVKDTLGLRDSHTQQMRLQAFLHGSYSRRTGIRAGRKEKGLAFLF